MSQTIEIIARPAAAGVGDSAGITVPSSIALPPVALAPHPANPREDLGDLTELVASLAELGILQPLVVATATAHLAGGWSAVAKGASHVILAGHRRHAAALAAGLDVVPCVVRDDLAGDEALVVMLAENDPAKRHALEPLAEARAFAELARRGWSQRRIAGRMGCRQPHVSKRLALLRLPEPVIEALASGKLTPADCAELTRLSDHPDRALKALAQIGGSPWDTAQTVVTKHLADIDREHRAADVQAELEAEGIKVVDPGVLGPFGYAKRLDDDADTSAHRDAGCLVGVARYGSRELYCRDPDSHEGTPAELPRWSASHGAASAATDAARAERDRQRAAAARARKEAAARLAARPLAAALAAEVVSLALIARHADAQCLETAVRWLRAAGLGPDDGDHYSYAEQVTGSGDQAAVRRLAGAMALAADERATGGAGEFADRWGARQVAYLDRLIAEVGYEPGEWEQARLEEARGRLAARTRLSCPVCGCRPGKTCGQWIRLADGYGKCDAEQAADGSWCYRCACGGSQPATGPEPDPSPEDSEDGAGDRDVLFDALEDLVIAIDPSTSAGAELPESLANAIADARERFSELYTEQAGDEPPDELIAAARDVRKAAAAHGHESWTQQLRQALEQLDLAECRRADRAGGQASENRDQQSQAVPSP